MDPLIKTLVKKMKENLSDRIFSLNWPEGIKNDLISNMHKFLIILNQSYISIHLIQKH